MERVKRGAHFKTYCNTDCKNAFNNSQNWLARVQMRCANEPGLLKQVRDQISSVV